MTIDTADAIKFANLHLDVMTMTRTGSGFHIPVTSTPRGTLEDYVAICDRLGLQTYNDHWLAYAWATVEAIEARRSAARARLFRSA